MEDHPVVSIGIPVYNGEKYIAPAIECFLNQTFSNFEIVIVDNSSNDQTEQICMNYAKVDRRIRFYKNHCNLGAAINYNLTFKNARAEFFKWAAADDLCEPVFLEKCVEHLRNHPDVVLVFSKTDIIDKNGHFLRHYNMEDLNLQSEDVLKRYYQLQSSIRECNAVFGVIRSEVLKNTRLIGNYIGSDNCLLVDLALKGKFYEIPERLFLRREHAEASTSHKGIHDQLMFFDPAIGERIVLPRWRRYCEDFFTIYHAKLPFIDKSRLAILQIKCFKWRFKYFIGELWYGMKKYLRWLVWVVFAKYNPIYRVKRRRL